MDLVDLLDENGLQQDEWSLTNPVFGVAAQLKVLGYSGEVNRVKQYITKLIGEEYVIPTLGVWNNADDIDFKSLPEKFVLKCNNDSGGIVICKNKKDFDEAKTVNISECIGLEKKPMRSTQICSLVLRSTGIMKRMRK